MDGVAAVAQPVPTEVVKPCGKVATVFAKRLDERRRHEHPGIERPATGFDATGDVDGVADDRELGPVLGADIAPDDRSAMDADGDANRGVTRSPAALVPRGAAGRSTILPSFDHRNLASIVLARTLWLQGHSSQALEQARDAVDEASRIGHPLTLAIARDGATVRGIFFSRPTSRPVGR